MLLCPVSDGRPPRDFYEELDEPVFEANTPEDGIQTYSRCKLLLFPVTSTHTGRSSCQLCLYRGFHTQRIT